MDRRTPLAAGLDTFSVVLFVAIGRREHEQDSAIAGLIEHRRAVPDRARARLAGAAGVEPPDRVAHRRRRLGDRRGRRHAAAQPRVRRRHRHVVRRSWRRCSSAFFIVGWRLAFAAIDRAARVHPASDTPCGSDDVRDRAADGGAVRGPVVVDRLLDADVPDEVADDRQQEPQAPDRGDRRLLALAAVQLLDLGGHQEHRDRRDEERDQQVGDAAEARVRAGA